MSAGMQSESVFTTSILSVESDEEKEVRKSLMDKAFQDFDGKKIKNRVLLKELHPILNDSENLPFREKKGKNEGRRDKQKHERIGNEKIKIEAELATSSEEDILYTTNETVLTDLSQPTATFSLSYVNRYDGKTNKYCLKNILHLNNNKIIFLAANIAVLMNTESYEQGFFTGHTDIVSSLCLHPGKRIIASGQSGG